MIAKKELYNSGHIVINEKLNWLALFAEKENKMVVDIAGFIGKLFLLFLGIWVAGPVIEEIKECSFNAWSEKDRNCILNRRLNQQEVIPEDKE